jgi:hypothetical protein
VQLSPIPWGKPDEAAGRWVCQGVVDATPAVVIPFNLLVFRWLRRWGIA